MGFIAAEYGTDDCSYYDQRCLEAGGPYYCEQAPFWCATFPREPQPDAVHTWSRCTRQCLQDCDRESAASLRYCPASPDPRPGPFAPYGASLACHGTCYAGCLITLLVEPAAAPEMLASTPRADGRAK